MVSLAKEMKSVISSKGVGGWRNAQVPYLFAYIKGVFGKHQELSLGKEVGEAYRGRADFAGQQKECGHLGSGELQTELWRWKSELWFGLMTPAEYKDIGGSWAGDALLPEHSMSRRHDDPLLHALHSSP